MANHRHSDSRRFWLSLRYPLANRDPIPVAVRPRVHDFVIGVDRRRVSRCSAWARIRGLRGLAAFGCPLCLLDRLSDLDNSAVVTLAGFDLNGTYRGK